MAYIQDLPVEILQMIFRKFDRSVIKLEFLAKLDPSIFAIRWVCKLWNCLTLEWIMSYYPWCQGERAMETTRVKMLEDQFWELQRELYRDNCGYFRERDSILRRERRRLREHKD